MRGARVALVTDDEPSARVAARLHFAVDAEAGVGTITALERAITLCAEVRGATQSLAGLQGEVGESLSRKGEALQAFLHQRRSPGE
jgi:hypothetical protein